MEIKKVKWMIKKDLLTLWRHKVHFMSILLFPILMVALCGWGMGGSVENTPVVVVKQSTGDVTDQVINALKSDQTYDIKEITSDADKAKEDVDNGKYKAAIILSSNFEESDNKNAVLYIDSSDQLTTQTLVPTTQQIFASLSEKVGTQQVAANTAEPNALQQTAQTIKLQVNKIFGDIDYIDFLLPGVLAMSMFMSSMMTMGNTIAGERERGELARLFMTPTSISSVLAGKITSQVIRQLISAVILILSAIILFDATIKGSYILLFIVILVSLFCFVGFGMMFSSTARTQEDYIQIVMPIAMPMMFICGVFFPTQTMPPILQEVAQFLPLTYANDAFRTIMIQGGGLGDITLDLVILLAFGLVFFIIGVARFNRDI